MSLPFSVAFVFLGLPMFGMITVILMVAKTKSREEKLFRVGVAYLKGMKNLLACIQQHRGLSNSYLSGNIQIGVSVIATQALVKSEIANIELIDSSINSNSKWESILDHWFRLEENYRLIDTEYNIKQHNMLIANLLYLMDDIAYEHHLGKSDLLDANDTDWRYLLSIAEYIGQARALGMGAVSRGECSTLLRSQLNHLRAKIMANMNNAWSDATLQDFQKFLLVIDECVVIDTPSISPADYFKLATACIEHILVEFDKQIEKMQFHRS
jgi:hypothetical protein